MRSFLLIRLHGARTSTLKFLNQSSANRVSSRRTCEGAGQVHLRPSSATVFEYPLTESWASPTPLARNEVEKGKPGEKPSIPFRRVALFRSYAHYTISKLVAICEAG